MNDDRPFRACLYCSKPAVGHGSKYRHFGTEGRYYHKRCRVRAEDEARYPQTVGSYLPYQDPANNLDLLKELNDIKEKRKSDAEKHKVEIDAYKTRLNDSKTLVNQVMERMNGMEEKLEQKMEAVRKEMLSTISQLSTSKKMQKKGKSVVVSSDSESGDESDNETDLTPPNVVNDEDAVMQIFVRDPPKIFALDVKPSTTVRDVMIMLEQKQRIPVDLQRIIFHGAQLREDSTLSSCGVEKHSTIQLVVRLLSCVSCPKH